MATTGIQSISSSVQQVLVVSQAKSEGMSSTKSGFGSVFEQSIQSKSDNVSNNQSKKASGKEEFQTTNVKDQRVNDQRVNDTNSTSAECDCSIDDVLEDSSMVVQQLEVSCDMFMQAILDVMDITKEQLDEAMEVLGLTVLDLFQQENLTNLFLQLNGTQDMSILLTDETMASNLQLLVEQAETMNPLEQLDLTPEDAKVLLLEFQKLEQPNEEVVIEKSKGQEEPIEESKAVEHEQFNTSNASNETEHTMNSKQGFSSDQKQTRQETTKEVEILVNGSSQISQEAKVSFMDQLAPTSQAREIVQQIVNEIKVTISESQTSMEMVLTPETLGRVSLTVTAKDGVMTAHMITESEAAKEAIESQITTLKETLDNQNLKVDAVEVTVAANNFDFLNQNQMQQENKQQQEAVKRSGNKLKMMEEETEEDIQTSNRRSVNASIGKGTQIDLNA